MNPDEIPPSINFHTFKVSPKNNHIIWYSPTKGLLKLKIMDKTIDVIHPPDEWYNSHPFFSVSTDEEQIYFVDQEGNEFNTFNLLTNDNITMQIPYPFGTIFRVSPDNKKILFISGYGQSQENPQYMFSEKDGTNPIRFSTDTFLTERELIAWMPDSSGVVLIENKKDLIFRSYQDPSSKQQFISLPPFDSVLNFTRIDNLLYLLTDTGYWHIIDMTSKKEVGRIPINIAQELHRPNFIPWKNTAFLIEETLQPEKTQFKRLWLSDHTGIKKLLVDKYQETEIKSLTPQI